jgi:hypothetical protein
MAKRPVRNYLKCINCKNKISKTNYLYGKRRCGSCAKKGKRNSQFGRGYGISSEYWTKENRKKLSKKRLGIRNPMYGKIGKLNPLFGIKRPKYVINKISKKLKGISTKFKKCNHHLDLNTNNNSKDNIYRLTNSKHHLFHRFAYHYLLELYWVKEILKYKKWFERKHA